ncbi:hypothetical protein HOD38_02510 [archaeon]|nr:hypothetical protein [archaeon]
MGEELVEASGLRWAQGKRFCLECYNKNITNDIAVSKSPKTKEYLIKETKISKLKINSNFKEIRVEVVDKISEEKRSKYGKKLILGKFQVKDDSGETILTLWSSDINKIKKGDVLIIKNGYVREYMDEKYLTLGKEGELIILE